MSRQRLWDVRFLEMAKLVSTWSKDPSTQVGAVLVDPCHRVVSLGFNGFPRAIADDARLRDRARAAP
jgi:dCMP deaminase